MGRPTNHGSLRSIAPFLGISKSGLHRSQLHVAFAERYPWLQSLTQTPVLRIRRALRTIPPDEHDTMMSLLEGYSGMKASEIARAASAWCDLSAEQRRSLYKRTRQAKFARPPESQA
jgi:hypothetical protein